MSSKINQQDPADLEEEGLPGQAHSRGGSSSPSLREPVVQIVNDSEFSSPPRDSKEFGSSNQDFADKSDSARRQGSFVLNLNTDIQNKEVLMTSPNGLGSKQAISQSNESIKQKQHATAKLLKDNGGKNQRATLVKSVIEKSKPPFQYNTGAEKGQEGSAYRGTSVILDQENEERKSFDPQQSSLKKSLLQQTPVQKYIKDYDFTAEKRSEGRVESSQKARPARQGVAASGRKSSQQFSSVKKSQQPIVAAMRGQAQSFIGSKSKKSLEHGARGNSSQSFLSQVKTQQPGVPAKARNLNRGSISQSSNKQNSHRKNNSSSRSQTNGAPPGGAKGDANQGKEPYSPKISVMNEVNFSGTRRLKQSRTIVQKPADFGVLHRQQDSASHGLRDASPRSLNPDFPHHRLQQHMDPPPCAYYDGQNIFEEDSQNIKVVIRVRPLNQRELDDPNSHNCVWIENQGTQIVLDRGADTKTFNFDFVGHEKVDQAQIFNLIAKPIAASCLQGYNGTIFAYGQTGAGKTFTIQGPSVQPAADLLALNSSATSSQLKEMKAKANQSRGIMQRSFEYLFECIQAEQSIIDERGNGSALQFLVKCSFLEIYNEQIKDLLDPTSLNLQIREDINKGVYVEGLSEEMISCQQDMMRLIERGTQNRHVGATSMNRASSRSHSVLTTIIESKSRSETGVWNVKQSRFHIIDLAGSERQKVANTEGERLKEAGMINKSLSALGNVINCLVEHAEGRARHVPYRDSKLTFILRDSLGGNSKTVIIANISPSFLNLNETLSTLKFAQRAKLIQNKAVINEDSAGTLILLKNEIKKLKKDLELSGRQIEELKTDNKKQVASSHDKFICRICEGRNQRGEALEDEFDAVNIMDQLEYSQKTSSQDEMRPSDPFNSADHQEMISQLSMLKQSTPSEVDLRKVEVALRGSGQPISQNSSEEHLRRKVAGSANERAFRAERVLAGNLTAYVNSLKQLRSLREQNSNLGAASDLLETKVKELELLVLVKQEYISQLEAQAGDPQSNGLESEKVQVLESEIEYLKEIVKKQIDKEQVPEILMLKAKAEELKLYHEAAELHKDSKDPIAKMVESQLTDSASALEDLSAFFNTKCSLQANLTLQEQLKEEQQKREEDKQQFKAQLDELQSSYDQLLASNLKVEEREQKISREYGRAKVEIQSLQGELRALREKNSSLSEELATAKDFGTNQSSVLSGLQKEINNLTEELNKSHQTMAEQVESLTKDKNFSQIIIDQLKAEVEGKAQQLTAAEDLQLSTEARLEESSHEMVVCKEEVAALQNSLDEAKVAYEQLRLESKEAQGSAEEKEALIVNLKSEEDHLKLKVAELEARISELEERIAELEQENQNLLQQIQSLESEKEKIKEHLHQSETNLKQQQDLGSSLSQQVDNLKQQVTSLTKMKDDHAEEAGHTSTQLAELEGRLQVLENEAAERDEKLAHAKTALSEKAKIVADLELQLASASAEKDRLLEEHKMASSLKQEEADNLVGQIEALQQKVKMKEQEEEESGQSLQSLRHHIKEQTDIIASQKDQLREMRELTTEVSGDRATKEKELLGLREQLQKKELDLQRALMQLDEIKSDLEGVRGSLTQEMSMLQKSVEAIQKEKIASANTAQDLSAKVKILTSEKEAAESQITDLSKAKADLEAKQQDSLASMKEIEEKVNVLDTARTQSEAMISSLQANLEAKTKEAEELREEIKDLRKRKEEVEAAVEEIEQVVKQLKEKLKTAELEKDTLESVKDEAEDKIAHLEEDIANLKQELASSKAELEASQEQLTSMAHQLEKIEAEKKATEDDLAEVSQLLDANVATLRNSEEQILSLATLLKETQALNQELNEKQQAVASQLSGLQQSEGERARALEEANSSLAEVRTSLKDKEAAILALEQAKNELQSSLDQATSSKAQIEEELESLKQEHESSTAALTLEVDKAHSQIQDLSSRASSLEADLAKHKVDLKTLASEKEEVTTELKMASLDRDEAQQQAASLKEKLDKLQAEHNEAIEAHRLKVTELVAASRLEMEEQEQEFTDRLRSEQEKVFELAESQATKQTEFLGEIQSLQAHVKKLSSELLTAERTLDLIKTSCFKKIDVIQEYASEMASKQDGVVSGILQRIQALDEEFEASGCLNKDDGDDEAEEMKNEANLMVSQIIFEVTKLFETILQRHKHQSKQELLAKQTEYQAVLAGLDSKRGELQSLINEKEKAEQALLEADKFHKTELSAQREAAYRLKQDLEEQSKDLEKELIAQGKEKAGLEKKIKELEKKVKTSKADLGEVNLQKKKLEAQLSQEVDQKQLIIQELQNYKQYLPEAESLLQEVNKRHQNSQKELDTLMQENTKLKTQYQSQLQAHQASIEKLKAEKDAAEAKREAADLAVQEVKDTLSNLQEQYEKVQGERDQLLAKGKEILQELARSTKEEQVLRQEIDGLQEQIGLRESEMREVVKTLKQFSEDSKAISRENDQLREDLKVMTGAQNTEYKIQLLMKTKEENNKLTQEVHSLRSALRKNEDTMKHLQVAASGHTMSMCQSVNSGVEEGTGGRHKKLLNAVIAHLNSLPAIDELARINSISLSQIPTQQLDMDFSEADNQARLLELISLINDVLSAKQPRSMFPSSQQLGRVNDPNVSQTNTSAAAILPPTRELFSKNKRDLYFINDASMLQEPTCDYEDGNETKLEALPAREIFHPGKFLGSQQQAYGQPPSKEKGFLSARLQEKTPKDMKNSNFKRISYESFVSPSESNPDFQDRIEGQRSFANPQLSVLHEAASDSLKHSSIQSIPQTHSFSMLPSGPPKTEQLETREQEDSPPVILNSYQNIYKQAQQQRDLSKNSRTSKSSSGYPKTVSSKLSSKAPQIQINISAESSKQSKFTKQSITPSIIQQQQRPRGLYPTATMSSGQTKPDLVRNRSSGSLSKQPSAMSVRPSSKQGLPKVASSGSFKPNQARFSIPKKH